MSKRPDSKPTATERTALIQLLISRGIAPGQAHDLISADRTRKENADKLNTYLTNLKRG